MKNKKKQIIITLVAIISLIVITVGVTYAFFNYAKEGTTDNTIKTGTITFLYTEVSGVGKGISLTDAYPVADSIGKVQVGEGKIFDFKVTSTISMNSSIGYQVTARKKTGSTLANSAVKVYLTEVNGTEQELLLSKYSELSQTDKVDISKYDERILYEATVPANTSNYEKNFRLRMWVSDDTDFSDGSMNGKTFTLTVNVYAGDKVVNSEEQNSYSNANIKSVSVDNTELTKVENKDYQYETTLPEGTTSTTLEIETENKYAKVTVEKIDSLAYSDATPNIKRLSTKKTLDLNSGDNYFKVTVTSENKETTNEYKIKISVEEPIPLLKDKIMKNKIITAEPTLTTTSAASGDESGLYVSTATNTGNPTYYFRGNVENNYVLFVDKIWRIVRINEDGTIRIVMKDGISSYNSFSGDGNYTNMYYTNSQGKTELEKWYQENIEMRGAAFMVASGAYYCEQAKVKLNDSYTSGNANMTLYSSYTPDFKCATDGNGYGVVNASVGLISYDELVYAGNYPYQGSNEYNNYYYKNNTMSPAGLANSVPFIWRADAGLLNGYPANEHLELYPVLNLNADILSTSGDGTEYLPFVVAPNYG